MAAYKPFTLTQPTSRRLLDWMRKVLQGEALPNMLGNMMAKWEPSGLHPLVRRFGPAFGIPSKSLYEVAALAVKQFRHSLAGSVN